MSAEASKGVLLDNNGGKRFSYSMRMKLGVLVYIENGIRCPITA